MQDRHNRSGWHLSWLIDYEGGTSSKRKLSKVGFQVISKQIYLSIVGIKDVRDLD